MRKQGESIVPVCWHSNLASWWVIHCCWSMSLMPSGTFWFFMCVSFPPSFFPHLTYCNPTSSINTSQAMQVYSELISPCPVVGRDIFLNNYCHNIMKRVLLPKSMKKYYAIRKELCTTVHKQNGIDWRIDLTSVESWRLGLSLFSNFCKINKPSVDFHSWLCSNLK